MLHSRLPWHGKTVPRPDPAFLERAWSAIRAAAAKGNVAVVLGTERVVDHALIPTALVINQDGTIAGFQDKVQLDPSEEPVYSPGSGRRVFETGSLKFGIAICHEGWRYPETVRWAAVRGARIVFHPHHTGMVQEGVLLTEWGWARGPYYEKAMMLRSMENTIYFASVNYALRFQESATSLIAPSGQCQAHLPYGQEGVLVQAINVEQCLAVTPGRHCTRCCRHPTLSLVCGFGHGASTSSVAQAGTEYVAHRAPDQVHARRALERGEQRLRRGK